MSIILWLTLVIPTLDHKLLDIGPHLEKPKVLTQVRQQIGAKMDFALDGNYPYSALFVAYSLPSAVCFMERRRQTKKRGMVACSGRAYGNMRDSALG